MCASHVPRKLSRVNALDLLYIPIAIVTAPLWAGKKRHGWSERFGKIKKLPVTPAGVSRVLLHAVSVGEVSALRALVPMLAEQVEVVVSATTDTGLARARELFGAMKAERDSGGHVIRHAVHVVRYPLDFSWCVKRMLDAVHPDVVGLVELEVWPNFVRACQRRGVPIAVINGRLSSRSFKGYQRAKVLLRPTFARLSAVAAQDETYAERFRAMGVPSNLVCVTGSMKWDATKIEDEVAGAQDLAREMGFSGALRAGLPLVVGGSTAEALDEAEEALIVRAAQAAAKKIGTDVLVLCAPRKPERFNVAAAAMPGCVRRSLRPKGFQLQDGKDHERSTPNGGLFLLDTIGELRKAYALADVVVIGRSFGRLYGSDPIEPIALGKATVIGPEYDDFSGNVAALHAMGGIEVVAGADIESELMATLARLLADAQGRRAMGEQGRACIRQQQGATRRHVEMLVALAKCPT